MCQFGPVSPLLFAQLILSVNFLKKNVKSVQVALHIGQSIEDMVNHCQQYKRG